MFPRAHLVAVACAAWLLGGAPAFGQSASLVNGYQQASWTEVDGVALGEVTAITQDATGYLWLATDIGLVRFDGARFVRWDAIGPRLAETRVNALITSRDGSVWVALANSSGVARILNDQLETYDWRVGMLQGPISALLEDRHGTLWVGGVFGLAQFADGKWSRIGPGQGIPESGTVTQLFEDGAGTVWAAMGSTLLRWSAERQSFELFQKANQWIRSMVSDASGRVWIPDAASTFRPVASDQPPSLPSSGERDAVPALLLHSRRGFLWVATADGLSCVCDDDWSSARVMAWPVRSEAPADAIRVLYEDREGNIWIGRGGGLSRLTSRGTTPPITAHPALGGRAIRVVAVDDRAIWLGTATGVLRIGDGAIREFGKRDGLAGQMVSALHLDADGTVWVATDAGVARLREGTAFVPLPTGARTLTRIVAIASDGDGGAWLCDFTGLYHWSKDHLTPAGETTSRYGASSVLRDSKGRVWVGYVSGGLVVLDQGTWRPYSSRDGLPDAIVSQIYEDSRGGIWAATSQGIAKFENGRFIATGESHDVTGVIEDVPGHLWLVTRRGLVRSSRSALARAATRSDGLLEYQLLDASDGFEPVIWVGAPTVARDANGTLLFVTRTGLGVVAPDRVLEVPTPPRPRIERFVVDDQVVDARAAVRLTTSTKRLQLDFTSLSLTAPAQLRFRYQLEGFDTDWREETSRRQAFYTNLPAGSYRFRIAARRIGGAWTEPTELGFSIPAPFYRTTWFYLVGLLALSAGAGWAWRTRVNNLRQKYAAVVAERARVGREVHDNLLQGLVAAALQLQGVADSLGEAPGTTRATVERIRDNVERSIRETRSSIWELRSPLLETRGFPSALREMTETLLSGSGIEFTLNVLGTPFRSRNEVEQHLLRIAQEAVSNAVRHSGAAHIVVGLEYTSDSIVLRVSDDGCGLPTEHVAEQDDRFGLRIMRERAQLIAARFGARHNSGAGTEIEVVVPSART